MPPQVARKQVEDAYPLSPMQEGMLFHTLYEPGSEVYVTQQAYEIDALDADAFRRAWREVIRRHAVLRSAFTWTKAGRPVQIVGRTVGLPLTCQDWRELEPGELERRFDHLLAEERRLGFELSRAPLMRLKLLRVSDETHRFVWTHHHVMLDGWSFAVVLAEVLTLYRGFVAGAPVELPPSRPYRDYIAWLQTRDPSASERHWRERLEGVSTGTSLDLGGGHGGVSERREERLHLGTAPTAALAELVRRERITAGTLVRAAWGLVLARSTGSDDVVFGAVVSGRPPELADVETMVGLFINTVPIRLQIDSAEPVRRWLGRLREDALTLHEHEVTPLADIQRWSEVPPGQRLFETLLVFENYPHDRRIEEGAGEVSVRKLHGAERTNFPVTLVASMSDRLHLKVELDAAQISRTAARRLLHQVAAVLAALPENLDRPVGKLPVLGAAERHQLLVEWVESEQDRPPLATLSERFADQVRRNPDRVAVLDGERHWTYRNLERRAGAVAAALAAQGVIPGTLVGVAAARSAEMVAGLLGILYAGGAYVPLDPAYPRDRLRFMLEDTGAPVVLVDAESEGALPATAAARLRLDRVPPGAKPGHPGAGPRDLAYVIYTSGSTGRPKGVEIEHRCSVAMLEWARSTFAPQDLEGVLASTSINFDLSIFELFLPLTTGGCVILAPDALALPSMAAAERVTLVNTVPSAMAELVRQEALPRSVRTVNLAGEPLRRSLTDGIYRLGTVDGVYNLYGPSEDTTYSTQERIDRNAEHEPRIGRPITGSGVYLHDARLRAVPMGAAGELCLAGHGLTRGYLRRPSLTAERLVPHPFARRPGERLYRTGDLARYLPDGRLQLLGRIDRQVKVRGFRIELGEIEAALSSHEAVEDVSVTVRDDGAEARARIVAYVVPVGDRPPDAQELRSFLDRRVPQYMIPSLFVPLDALPRTPNGKVDRSALPVPGRSAAADTYVPPRTEVEAILASIWSEVLGLPRVGVNDDFFELGGDSILSIQVVTRARRHDLQIEPRQVFEHSTIALLAAVAGAGGDAVATASQEPVVGDVPLTPVQERFFGSGRRQVDRYNQGLLLAVREPLDLVLLRRAVAALLAHHDALRMRFERGSGGWRQRNASVREAGAPPVGAVDLDALPAGRRDEAMARVADQVQGSLDLGRGPICRFVRLRPGEDQEDRLLVVVHHLVVDGVSWRILLEDLAQAATALATDDAPQLPLKTTSYREWAERLRDLAGSPAALEDLPYWRALADAAPPALPIDHPGGPERNTVASMDTVEISLSIEETRALLKEVPAAYRTRINDVLLTALVRAFEVWTGDPVAWLHLELHGREHLFDGVDLSRTVGWFTSFAPVRLELRDTVGIGDSILAVKEQLRAIPHGGTSFGVLRYLRQEEDAASLRTLALPEVSFNYLGQVDRGVETGGAFSVAQGSVGSAASPGQRRDHLLDFVGYVATDRLSLSLRYSKAVHERASVESLGEAYLGALRVILDHCRSREAGGVSPSDFPLLDIDSASLQAAVDAVHFSGASANPRHVEDVYPLAPMQAGMLFHSLSAPHSGVYLCQHRFAAGALDAAALERALDRVIARHPVLRTAFVATGDGTAVQIVGREVRGRLERKDWSALAPAQRERRWRALAESDLTVGFNLSAPPLLRLRLIRMGPSEHRLLWTHHHLLMDGWSMPILMGELAAFYRSAVAGEDLELPEPRPYRSYIGFLARRDPAASEAFWRDYLKGFSAPTPLVVGSGRRTESAAASAPGEERLDLSRAEVAAIEHSARRGRLTLSTVIRGAWAALLARYTGQDDVVFGAVVSGRPPELDGVETMVGLFINSVPVRAATAPDRTVAELLEALQADQLAIQSHEHDPLASIQRWSEVPGGTGLFESLVVFENYPSPAVPGGEDPVLDFRRLAVVERVSYPLSLAVSDGLSSRLQYDRRRFEATTMRRLLGHFRSVLEGMATDPDRRLGDLALLSAAERHQVLSEWSTTRPPRDHALVLDRIARAAALRPDAVALVQGGEHLTYEALLRRAARLAGALERTGVAAGDRVGIFMRREEPWIVAILGVLSAGAAYVPLEPDLPPERLAFLIRDSGVRLIVVADLDTALDGTGAELLPLGTVPAVERDGRAVAIAPESVMYLLYTSGSTGAPKGVAVPHRALASLVATGIELMGSRPGRRVMQYVMFGFDPSVLEVFSALASGATLEVYCGDRFSNDAIRGFLLSRRIEVMTMASSLLPNLDAAGLPDLETVLCGGERLPSEGARRWSRDHRLLNTYGPTESTVLVTGALIEGAEVADPSIGRPTPGVTAHVVDRALEPVAAAVPGELVLGGGQLAHGYHRRPDRTAEHFVPHPWSRTPGERLYRTGDLVRYLPTGRLEFLGRIDAQVKIRGQRVEPGEIEIALGATGLVAEAAVVARVLPAGTHQLVAYTVPADPAEAATADGRRALVHRLEEVLRETLAHSMVPGRWVFLDALPLTPQGKVDRAGLPEPHRDDVDDQEITAPRSQAESILATIWQRTLGLERVGIHDDFFELGGDSILSIQIVNRALTEGLEITPRQIFEHPTIAGLARVAGSRAIVVAEQGEVTGPVPLTPVQRWFFDRPGDAVHHFNQSLVLQAGEELRADALARSLRRLVEHHDALRLRFHQDAEGGWHQECAPVAEALPAPCAVIDLSRVATGAQGVEAVAASLQASLDLERGPVMRCALLRTQRGAADRLLLIAHHLVVDGVSWRLVLADLESLYRAFTAGERPELPAKTTSFRTWARCLEEHARAESLRAELDLWRAGPAVAPLPVERVERSRVPEVDTVGAARTASARLGRAETRALLQDVPAAYRTQVNDVLLAALAQALCGWTGGCATRIDLEGHGREELFEDVDLARTVGWFTAIYPVTLDLSGTHGPGEVLKRVKETLRAVPGRGVGYGVLRYLSPWQEALAAEPSPDVAFNYLGQVDGALDEDAVFVPAAESPGPQADPRAPRDYLLEINCIVRDGRFHASLRYGSAVYQRATMEGLLEGFLSALRELIAHCRAEGAGGYTPSDFPLAALDQEALDRLWQRAPDLEDLYPLSPIQLGMFLHAQEAPDSEVYVEQLACSFRGPLDVVALEQAWQEVVARHPVLRTSFLWEGLDRPLQAVHRRVHLPLERLSWSDVPAEEREARLGRLLARTKSEGFDLARAPLIRLTLIELGPREYRFVWTTHHVLTDGWSTPVVLRELFALYGALLRGETVTLEPRRPFRDYIAWLARQDLEEAETFWRRELAGVAAPTPLGIERWASGGAARSEGAGDLRRRLSREATAQVEALARRSQVTLNTLIQGAWSLVLARHAGVDDVVFGATVAGRPAELPGVETIVGPFINTIPVRVRLPGGDVPLELWLRDLQAGATARQPYEYAPSVQEWSEVPMGVPLFESLLVVENYPAEKGETGDRKPSGLESLEVGDVRTAVRTRYPVNMVVFPGETLGLYLAYETARLDAETARRLIERLERALLSMAESSDRSVEDLSLLSAEELAVARAGWSAEDVVGGVSPREIAPRGGRLLLLDGHRRSVPPPAVGAVWVREPDGTEAPSGLLGRLAQGRGLEILGPAEPVLRVRGRRIYPREAEAALEACPGVRRAVVVAVPETGAPAAAVLSEPGAALDVDTLRRDVLERAPRHLVPPTIAVVSEGARAGSGTPDREALAVAARAAVTRRSRSRQEVNGVAPVLLGLWREVLGVEAVDPADSFLDLGGHSLLAVRLLGRVRRAFGVELELRELFEAPSVAQLAPRIEAALGLGNQLQAPPIEPLAGDRQRDLPPSFAQQRLWFLDQLAPGNPYYTQTVAVRLTGCLDLGALAATLNEIVHRHEVLRTSFPVVDGRPVQRIAAPRPVPLPVVDLSSLVPDRGVRELGALATEQGLLPFDLARGPVLRALLARLGGEEHAIFLTLHHIAIDAWSMAILTREVAELYNAFVAGRPSPLPPLPIQYADYAWWQRRWMQGEVLERHLDFWRRHLGGDPSLLELPTDRPRPDDPTYRGSWWTGHFPDRLAAEVSQLARREGATLFMILLAAFDVLLARYAGQDDVMVGVATSNRSRPETENLIGFLVNTLPLRVDLSGAPTFRELLRRVREASLQVFAHQELPLERLIEAVRPERSEPDAPLFRTTFGVRNAPRETLEMEGLEVGSVGVEEQTARFDLTLWVAQHEGSLSATWILDADLFDRSTIERMHARYVHLLESAVRAPDTAIDLLEMEPETERKKRLHENRQRHRSSRAKLRTSKPQKITIEDGPSR